MMKGIDLVGLAQKIEANKALKLDAIVDTAQATLQVQEDKTVVLELPDQGEQFSGGAFPILPLAHDQIGARLEIPGKYYDRMLAEAPDLLATNVNAWFRKKPERRMVRTLGGDLRAFLSNRYNRIENEEIAEAVLPVLFEQPDMQVVSSEITDRRMYIQAIFPRLEREVKRGDIVQAGVTISNSEVGHGSVMISPLIWRLVCLNGMVRQDARLRANHVGGRIDETSMLYADDTRQADDRAILLKVRDHVRGAVNEASFATAVEQMAVLAGARLSGSVEKAVEVLAKKVGATEGERSGILRSLIEGGDLSAWGVVNAVTHQAHTARNYDRAVEFEQMGGQLLNLARDEWRTVLEAA